MARPTFAEFEKRLKETEVTITGEKFAEICSKAMNKEPWSEAPTTMTLTLTLFTTDIMRELFPKLAEDTEDAEDNEETAEEEK